MINILTFIGAQDHKRPFNVALWLKCMREKSREPPKLFPNDFKESATVMLYDRLGLTVEDISHENCRNVYVNEIQTLI